MQISIGRILIIAVAVEILAILVLVGLVAILGPSNPDAARAYAERLGYWVGPIAGFVFCVIGGWLAAKNLNKHQVLNGLVLGAVVAAIDVALLLAGGAAFQPIFAISNIGRLIAGSMGGWAAAKTR